MLMVSILSVGGYFVRANGGCQTPCLVISACTVAETALASTPSSAASPGPAGGRVVAVGKPSDRGAQHRPTLVTSAEAWSPWENPPTAALCAAPRPLPAHFLPRLLSWLFFLPRSFFFTPTCSSACAASLALVPLVARTSSSSTLKRGVRGRTAVLGLFVVQRERCRPGRTGRTGADRGQHGESDSHRHLSVCTPRESL